jgi:GDP-D-mannose dehydratase
MPRRLWPCTRLCRSHVVDVATAEAGRLRGRHGAHRFGWPSAIGLNADDHVVVHEQFRRPAEVDFLQGNSAKAKERQGWTAKTSLEDLVAELVDWVQVNVGGHSPDGIIFYGG